jgi:DNA invertase Pin-like site-specific DNA recombinase
MTKVMDIYARISVDYDGTTRSVESQEEDCRWAVQDDHPDWRVGEVFRDHAKSGWDPKVYRPEFEALMARLESGASQGVMVYDLTRFTRKPIEGERLLALAKRGVTICSITTSYNLTTADGRAAFRNELTRAAQESDKISERVRRGKRNKARRGKSNASWRGFARDGYLPAPEGWERGEPRERVSREQLAQEQAIVKDLAERILAGETLMALARELDARGVRTVTGKEWLSVDIRQMLEAPSLAGLITHNGQIVGTMEQGPHALDRDTWERLQLHFASRKRGRPPTKYLLTSLLTCGRCGGTLHGRPQVNRRPYPDGEVARQYWCAYSPGGVNGKGCGRLNIDQRFADAVVEQAVLERLGDPRHAARMARRAAAAAEARQEVVAELRRLEADAEALASKTLAWGFERVDAAMRPIDARLTTLRERLATLDATEDQDGTAYEDAREEWRVANLATRRAMVRKAFPDGITILPATSRGRGALRQDRFQFGSPELAREAG